MFFDGDKFWMQIKSGWKILPYFMETNWIGELLCGIGDERTPKWKAFGHYFGQLGEWSNFHPSNLTELFGKILWAVWIFLVVLPVKTIGIPFKIGIWLSIVPFLVFFAVTNSVILNTQ